MRSLGPICAASVFIGALGTEASETGGVLNSLSRFAQTVRVTGHVRTDYFRSSKTLDDEADFFGITHQLKALPEFSRFLDAKIEARVTNPAIGEGISTDSSLLEGYITIHLSRADVRLGRQIVAWGRADGINPTDNLTPRDFVVLLPFEDDQRFGTTGAKLDVVLPAGFTLSTFATPWFEPAKIPFPADAAVVQVKPARSFANTELGLKIDRTGAGFDWSISYFRGFSLTPSLRLANESSGSDLLELRYDHVDVFGADFARNFGRFGFRGEIAYTKTRDRSGMDPEKRNPNLYFVVGVDRTFFDKLNLNLQYFRREVRHYYDPLRVADPARRSIAIFHAILNGERDRSSDGLSFRVSNKWFHETLEAEVFGVLNLTRRDRFARGSVTYSFTDHWKGTVGTDFFSGETDTQFGLQKRNRGPFAELKFAF